MKFYDILLLLSGWLIYTSIFIYIYIWLSDTINDCKCMDYIHIYLLRIYFLFFFAYYSIQIAHLLIYDKLINTYNFPLIFLNIAMIVVVIDYYSILDSCYCSKSIEKELLLFIAVLHIMWYIMFILSYVYYKIRNFKI